MKNRADDKDNRRQRYRAQIVSEIFQHLHWEKEMIDPTIFLFG